MKVEKNKFDTAVLRANEAMKGNNGHTFETILKTRCIWCGRRPGAKGNCHAWFNTFLWHLSYELTGVYGIPEQRP